MFGPQYATPDSYRDLLREVDELEIYAFIFEKVLERKVPDCDQLILSPMRSENRPSFCLYKKGNKMRWKDYGLVGQEGSDALALYQEITGYSYYEALGNLYTALNKNNYMASPGTIERMQKSMVKKSTQSGVSFTRNFTEEHLEFWAQYHITEEALRKFNVFLATEVWFEHKRWARTTDKDPIFLYLINPQTESWQVYRPLTRYSSKKFRTKNLNGILMGENVLPPEGDILFLTKAYKDVMVFNAIGYPAVCPTSESAQVTEIQLYDLGDRFSRIIPFYDNDDTGINAMNVLLEMGYPGISVPKEEDCKDPSDFIKKYGPEELRNLITNST